MDAAQATGFTLVAREQTTGDLDIHLVVLQPPPAMTIVKALRRLREADPGGTYDFNHIYTGVGWCRPLLQAIRHRRKTSPRKTAPRKASAPAPPISLCRASA